jgi:hypothetical protein
MHYPEVDNLYITRTFSKLYGLASLRIGYVITSAEVRDGLMTRFARDESASRDGPNTKQQTISASTMSPSTTSPSTSPSSVTSSVTNNANLLRLNYNSKSVTETAVRTANKALQLKSEFDAILSKNKLYRQHLVWFFQHILKCPKVYDGKRRDDVFGRGNRNDDDARNNDVISSTISRTFADKLLTNNSALNNTPHNSSSSNTTTTITLPTTSSPTTSSFSINAGPLLPPQEHQELAPFVAFQLPENLCANRFIKEMYEGDEIAFRNQTGNLPNTARISMAPYHKLQRVTTAITNRYLVGNDKNDDSNNSSLDNNNSSLESSCAPSRNSSSTSNSSSPVSSLSSSPSAPSSANDGSRGYNLTILAAGKGTRMHADTGVLMHKILAEIEPGMSLLRHKLTQFAGKVNSFVIVTGYRDHEVLREIASIMKDLNKKGKGQLILT